jgi:hypothetical protein
MNTQLINKTCIKQMIYFIYVWFLKKIVREIVSLECTGNKSRKLKLLLPIIEPQITKDAIFVEPFSGLCVVAINLYKNIMTLIFISII